jgi:hypothetical protein
MPAKADYSELTAITAAAEQGYVTGIIRNVGIGRRDTNLPCLWFDVYISEGTASLQVIPWADAHDIVGRVYDVRELNGFPCWMDVSTPGIARFVRLWDKIT